MTANNFYRDHQRAPTETTGRDPGTWSHPVAEVSGELGISDRATFRLIEQGRLRSFRVGGLRRVLHADLLDFIASQREQG